MPAEQKLKIIHDVLGDYYTQKSEYLFHCPECQHHKAKLSINFEKGKYKCWVCDYRGNNIGNLVRKHGSYSQKRRWQAISTRTDITEFDNLFVEEETTEEKQRIDLPKEFIPLYNKYQYIHSHKPRKYLTERGIDDIDIRRWKIGYCHEGSYAGRVIIPSFDSEGYINYFIARSYRDDYLKYLNPPAKKNIVFNDLYVDWDEDVVLVEGVFDAIKAPNAIPVLGSTLTQTSALFRQIGKYCPRVFVAFDADAKKKTRALVRDLIHYGIEVYDVQLGCFEDVGEMSKQQFAIQKRKAKQIDLDDMLTQSIMEI